MNVRENLVFCIPYTTSQKLLGSGNMLDVITTDHYRVSMGGVRVKGHVVVLIGAHHIAQKMRAHRLLWPLLYLLVTCSCANGLIERLYCGKYNCYEREY